MRVLIKSVLFGAAMIGYFVISILIVLLCGFNFKRARPFLVRLISLTSRVGLKIMNVKLRKNFAPINPLDNFLIVSNHLSYLDVLIISSYYPTCFVTSQEMKETPFLGQICLLGGCLFVERRSKKGIHGEVAEIADALKSGLNVAIFPEATSTNGEAVIRFRRPLFQSAIDSKTNVLPVCLNYHTLDGEKVSLKNRDKVFWYGDRAFFSHAMTFFSHKVLVAELSVMDVVSVEEFSDKVALSDKCYEIVSNEFETITHAV